MECSETKYLTLTDLLRSVLLGDAFTCGFDAGDDMIFRRAIVMGADGYPAIAITERYLSCGLVYADYETYVLAQGGVIADEALTEEFICYLLNN